MAKRTVGAPSTLRLDTPAETTTNRLVRAAGSSVSDVHWPAAAFGYFPTYTLGTIYAAQLDAAMRRDLDLDAGLAAGDLGPAIGWLNARIHRHGRLLPARRLIAEAIGREPDERALVGYLEAKFRALYGL